MTYLQSHSTQASAGAYMHLTAGIAGGQYFRLRIADAVKLFSQYLPGHFRLHKIVNACPAATPLRTFESDKVQVRYGSQHLQRSFSSVLSVQQVTRCIVRNNVFADTRSREWRDCFQLLTDITNTFAKHLGRSFKRFITVQQMGV